MRVAGVPFDPGRHPQGRLAATACVLHRTYGARGQDQYAGAYSIGKNGRGGVGIGFHFLIGKKDGQWVQFYDTTTEAAHALGANGWAVGIELDGVNEDPLTDWQVRALGWVIGSLPFPHTYYDGPRKRVGGYLSHNAVPGSTHTDKVMQSDWDKVMRQFDSPSAPNSFRRDLAAIVLPFVQGLPDLDASTKDAAWYIVRLQQGLNIASGAGLAETGIYDQPTVDAVSRFQRFLGITQDPPGFAYNFTRFYLAAGLQNIRDGKA